MALERELEAFRRELPRLLQEGYQGKYALVGSRFFPQVDSVWPTYAEAIEAGYDRFGLAPFLVKEITDREVPRYFSRNVCCS